jgi:hypothetical protein
MENKPRFRHQWKIICSSQQARRVIVLEVVTAAWLDGWEARVLEMDVRFMEMEAISEGEFVFSCAIRLRGVRSHVVRVECFFRQKRVETIEGWEFTTTYCFYRGKRCVALVYGGLCCSE